MTMTVTLDMSTLTNGDVMDIEDACQMPWSKIAKLGDEVPYRVGLALIFVVLRRTDPTITMAKLKAMRPTDFDLNILPVEGDASTAVAEATDPTGAAPSPA